MEKVTNYPFILIHGFLCWGEEEGIFDLFPTFGMWNGNAKHAMEKAGYEVYSPSVGPLSGMWERACVLYAYIKGGRVDYGKAYSEAVGCARYGDTYPGVVPNWGELDENGKIQKVNLVGHSFGGPTVRTLIHLLAEGSATERNATDPAELSDLFKGGKANWIHACVALAGTHSGVTLPDAGRPIVNPMAAVCFGLGMLFSGTPVARFYRWHLDNYGISSGEKNIPFNKEPVMKLVHAKVGNIFWELSTEGAEFMTKHYKTYDSIYYFTFHGCRTKAAPFGLPGQIPTSHMWIPLRPFSLFECFYTDAAHGRDWQPNDGLVNVETARYPKNDPAEHFTSVENCKTGIWYWHDTEDKDHTSYMGILEKPQVYNKFFVDLGEKVCALPETK